MSAAASPAAASYSRMAIASAVCAAIGIYGLFFSAMALLGAMQQAM